jgi:endonuclease/exonuclease/phosphatase family metal-dependent hydrolase
MLAIRSRCACLVLWLLSVAASGCAGGYAIARRATVELPVGPLHGLSWFGPVAADDVADLARWRRAVGPPVVVSRAATESPSDRLVVVNWNVHVGGGDVVQLFKEVRRQAGPNVPIVMLLQEAYRDGPEVPASLDPAATFASLIRGLRRDGAREEVESVAAALGLHAYYVPSMRNGNPLTSAEDRGNAILSTAALHDLSAIELPFERQRRVAVAASVSGTTSAGHPWRVRLVSAHLDNMSGPRRLWIAGSEFGRMRQARGLLAALSGEKTVVLGADLNTLFGFGDRAYLEALRAFPETRVTDRRPTFGRLLRLDHLFFRLAGGWTASFRRAEDNYGSDHHPLIGTIRFTADSRAAAAETR